MSSLYLDTSAVLRAILETGTSPEVENRFRSAEVLLTSRLATIEASRAIHRLRQLGRVTEARLADAEREIEHLWARCEVWEMTPQVCEAARHVAPGKMLRALDAIHLATFAEARKRIADLEMLTVDDRLRAAAGSS